MKGAPVAEGFMALTTSLKATPVGELCFLSFPSFSPLISCCPLSNEGTKAPKLLSDHHVHSHLLTVDTSDYMVGSYGPRPAEYDFLTTMEEAPKGILARGNYVIKSKFTDDDKHDHLSWEWNLHIKKDWKD